MRRRRIPNAETFIAAIQDEISHNPEGRYFHRLHVLLHLLQGAKTSEVSRIYGDSVRSIQYWLQRFLSQGFTGLLEGKRPGRPSQLSQSEQQNLQNEICRSPRELGYQQNLWDGPLLSFHIKKHYKASLSVRQCQRLFHHLGFTLQRPRRQAQEADINERESFKKNSSNG